MTDCEDSTSQQLDTVQNRRIKFTFSGYLSRFDKWLSTMMQYRPILNSVYIIIIIIIIINVFYEALQIIPLLTYSMKTLAAIGTAFLKKKGQY